MDALNDYFCLILSLGARGNASLHLLRLLFSVKQARISQPQPLTDAV
ncbi:MAG: hypothetical protein KME19_10470 [Microcoleus vaginatus WJT46-NPBG5]|nr:hypothetical protein [Microcoleus vaginatus WJT46-NPBG5]